MSGVDIEKMRKAHESHQTGAGDFLKLEDGDTLVYIHPPSREGDEWEPTEGTNFVPIRVHYGVGKNNGMAASLDPETNPIINHPWVKAELKKRKIRLTGECPIKTALEEGAIDDEVADNMRASTRFLWGMTPIKYRPSSRAREWTELIPKPGIALVGRQIFDGIMEVFYDHGDITNMTGAVLVRISKKGTGMNTKYTISPDPDSAKKPYVLPKPLRAAIHKAIAEGGECDLFRVAGTLIKAPSEVQSMLDGIEVESDVDDDEDEKPTRRKSSKMKAATKKRVEDDEDLLDDEDEDDDEPKAKAKSKVTSKKPAKKVVDEDEDEEDEEEEEKPLRKAIKRAKAEDEDEDEDDAPVKTKAKSKKAPPPDDDEEEDEEEEKPVKRAVKKPAKKIVDEDEDDEEEDEEPAPKKSAKKSAAAKKKVADDDEDEEDEDDEPAPRKKGVAKTRGKATPKVSDEEEIGLDDLEEALADLDDEEEEPRKKSA